MMLLGAPVRRRLCIAAIALAATAVSACGDDGSGEATERRADEAAGIPAEEAREENTVTLGGVRYRVNLFRQINPSIAPDRTLADRPVPEGESLWAAFLTACNTGGQTRTPTDRIALLDAFGERYERVRIPDRRFAYRTEPLEPEACLPTESSTAERTFSGVALLFRIPTDALTNRPFLLDIRAGDEQQAIELDV